MNYESFQYFCENKTSQKFDLQIQFFKVLQKLIS